MGTIGKYGERGNGTPSTCYYIDFDGTSFQITQTKELWLDYGKDNMRDLHLAGLMGMIVYF